MLARLYEVSLDELLSTDDKDEDIKAEVVDRIIREEEKQEKEEQKEHHNLIVNIINSSYVLVVVLAYLLIGFLIPGDGFGKGWIIFLTIPIVFSLVKCITHKNANLFAFPVLMAFVYVGIGMVWGIWHPTWLVFILIPIYYSITGAIVSTKKYKKNK